MKKTGLIHFSFGDDEIFFFIHSFINLFPTNFFSSLENIFKKKKKM